MQLHRIIIIIIILLMCVVTTESRFLTVCSSPAGAVPRAVRQRVHNVRVHTELLRVLRGAGGQQRGRGVPAAAERDHRGLRRAAERAAVPVHREDQVDRRHVHGRIRADQEHVRQQAVLARHRHGRLRSAPARAVGLRQRALVQQFPHQNRYVIRPPTARVCSGKSGRRYLKRPSGAGERVGWEGG